MPQVVVAEALRFLAALYPRGPWALVSIVPNGEDKTMRARTFRPGQEAEMGAWIAEHNTHATIGDGAPGHRNIYYHVNPIREDFGRKQGEVRPRREDISAVHYLHVDLDPRAKEPDDKAAARIQKALGTTGEYPRASIVVASGGGYNALWRLETPLQLDGTLEAAEKACEHNYGVEVALGGDHCRDIARILRLPGTINYPNAAKRERGRVVSQASIAWLEDTSYPLSMFPAVPIPGQKGTAHGGAASRGPAPRLRAPANVQRTGDPETIRQIVKDKDGVTDKLLRIVANGHDPQDPGHYSSRSNAQWYVTCELVRLGAGDDDIFAILTDPGLGVSEHVFAQGSPDRYALRQIERARERAIHPKLAELNEILTVIDSVGSDCKVVEEVVDEVLGRATLDIISFDAIKRRYCNQFVEIQVPGKNGNLVTKHVDLGSWWLTHKQRAQRKRIVFRPGVDGGEDYYNLWRGFAYVPRPGNGHEPFMKHILDNVCTGDVKLYNYLVGWMATAVQHPARPGQTAIVLRGGQGTGKGTLARVFGKLWGRHFLALTNADHLTSRFNAHLRDAVVVLADEAFYAGDKKHEGALKALITEASLSIEDKGVRIETAPNFCHLIVCSNSDWVVPVSTDDRRFCVIDVASTHKGDEKYWQALNDALEGSDGAGYSHLLYFLKTHDLSTFKLLEIPDTAARRDQQLRSLPDDDEWWLNRLEAGRVLPGQRSWTDPVPTEKVWDHYATYVQKKGSYRRSSETAFGAMLHKLCPGLKKHRMTVTTEEPDGPGGVTTVRKSRAQCYSFPNIAECRRAWSARHGQHDWPEDPDAPF